MRLQASPPLRSGFTLLELMAVLAIIALISFMTYPSFQAWTQSQKLREGVDEFRTNLIKARTKAMEEGRAYRCYWQTGGNSYRIAADEIEHWPELTGSAIGPSVSAAASVPGAWECNQTLPEGVQFLGASANPLAAETGRNTGGGLSGGGEFLIFQPDGTTLVLLPDGTEPPQIDIFIGAANGEERVLRLRAVTSVMVVFNPRVP